MSNKIEVSLPASAMRVVIDPKLAFRQSQCEERRHGDHDGDGIGSIRAIGPGDQVDNCRIVSLGADYASRQAFLDEMINPFNARMGAPLVPTVRGI
jgi:hypothetical protein